MASKDALLTAETLSTKPARRGSTQSEIYRNPTGYLSPRERTMNVVPSAASMLNSVIGTGILALPVAFSQVGWLLGSFIMVLCMLLSGGSLVILGLCVTEVGATSYGTMVTKVMGPRWGKLTGCIVAFHGFAVCIAYSIVIAQNLTDLLNDQGWVTGPILCECPVSCEPGVCYQLAGIAPDVCLTAPDDMCRELDEAGCEDDPAGAWSDSCAALNDAGDAWSVTSCDDIATEAQCTGGGGESWTGETRACELTCFDNRRFWVVVPAIGLVLPLCFLKNYNSLRFASMGATSSMLFLATVIAVYGIYAGSRDELPVWTDSSEVSPLEIKPRDQRVTQALLHPLICCVELSEIGECNADVVAGEICCE